jgi:hypothetical protein
MKLKSLIFIIVAFLFVAVISYYIGGSMRGTNSIRQSIHTPIVETERLSPPLKIANGAMNQEKIKVSNTSTTNENQIVAIEAEFGRKKKEIEEYYANRFRQLQQNVETTLKEYDAADRAAYARFTEQLKSTVSTSSGYTSMSGYVSQYGSVSAHGYYDGTTHTQVAGAPSVAYGRHVQRINKAIDNLMDEYELDFDHLQRRRACALDDLEKEKALALAAVRSQGASSSILPISAIAQGIVTGIIYSEENPLAVIDGKVIHEGQSIGGAKVVKINQDSVELEYAGNRWSQKVNETPSPQWP